MLVVATLLAHRHGEQRLVVAKGWPAATGRIDGVDLMVSSTARASGFRARVSYSFVIGEQRFASHRLRPGGSPFFMTLSRASAAIGSYQIGAPVIVRYDPRRPSDSAIELLPCNPARTACAVMAAMMIVAAAFVTLVVSF